MLILLAACTGPDRATTGTVAPPPTPTDPTAPKLIAGPEIVPPDSPSVRLVQRLIASTDRPTRASLVVSDGIRAREIGFPDFATDHDLPVLALRAETSYTVDATFTDALGKAVTESVDFDSGPTFSTLPNIELLSSDPTRMEPGYALFPTEVGLDANVVAVDAEGQVVGTWDSLTETTRSLAFSDGVLSAIFGNAVVRWTPTGGVLSQWGTGAQVPPDAIVLPVEGIHHEFAVESDGSFWSFHKDYRSVPDYPTSESDPTITGPAWIEADAVIHFAADGTILHDWSLADRLDPNRIGFNSLDLLAGGYDWSHGNAVVPLADGSGVLVSLRHQDAVVKLSLPDGDVEWILGNHEGWSPEFEPYLLEPVGVLEWPYHQHGPMLGADGRIVMFDNGNGDRTTPYSHDPVPGPLYSRIVQFEVDEEARTVTQVFESRATASAYPFFSFALGNADPLPVTGNLFATFAYLHSEEGVRNQSIGRGDKSVRLIEVDPATGDTVWDLSLSTTPASVTGMLCDRAIRVPSLYPSQVTERWLP